MNKSPGGHFKVALRCPVRSLFGAGYSGLRVQYQYCPHLGGKGRPFRAKTVTSLSASLYIYVHTLSILPSHTIYSIPLVQCYGFQSLQKGHPAEGRISPTVSEQATMDVLPLSIYIMYYYVQAVINSRRLVARRKGPVVSSGHAHLSPKWSGSC